MYLPAASSQTRHYLNATKKLMCCNVNNYLKRLTHRNKASSPCASQITSRWAVQSHVSAASLHSPPTHLTHPLLHISVCPSVADWWLLTAVRLILASGCRERMDWMTWFWADQSVEQRLHRMPPAVFRRQVPDKAAQPLPNDYWALLKRKKTQNNFEEKRKALYSAKNKLFNK